MRLLKTVSLVAVIGTATLLGGCATKESVEHAQSTADLADSDAKAAHGAADRAQSTADGAAKQAGDAMTLAQQANDKVDKLIADQEKRRHAAALYRRHHHRHHVASNTANCPAPQQKTELKSKKDTHKAAALQPSKSPLKTAAN